MGSWLGTCLTSSLVPDLVCPARETPGREALRMTQLIDPPVSPPSPGPLSLCPHSSPALVSSSPSRPPASPLHPLASSPSHLSIRHVATAPQPGTQGPLSPGPAHSSGLLRPERPRLTSLWPQQGRKGRGATHKENLCQGHMLSDFSQNPMKWVWRALLRSGKNGGPERLIYFPKVTQQPS